MTFKFVIKNSPLYLNKIFEFAPHSKIDTINSFAKLKLPSCKTKRGQKTLSYIGPSLRQSCSKNGQQCFQQTYAIETVISCFNKKFVTVMKTQYKEQKSKTIQCRNYKHFHEESFNFN